MQPIPFFAFALVAGGLAPRFLPATDALAGADALHGRYLEARSASVFAGACHYGSEFSTQGREALLAWHFDGGEVGGVPLAGVTVVAIVAGPGNLDIAGMPRRSELYADASAPAAARSAACAVVRARHRALLGRARVAAPRPIRFERAGDRFRVEVEGMASLTGALLPDRACCTMPLARWYEPFSDVGPAIVGESAEFHHAGTRWIPRRWARFDENSAFAAQFRWPKSLPPAASSSADAAAR